MKKLILLGSTGSIGTQSLDVVRRSRGAVRVVAMSAHSNIELFKEQVAEFRPSLISIWGEESAAELKAWCAKKRFKTDVLFGLSGLIETASFKPADLVLSSVVGSVGLEPLLAAIRAGTDIALANKEALVVAGELIMSAAKKRGVNILPVDSEHSAIFQCLKNEPSRAVRRILLTASGGPFYRCGRELAKITVEHALAHPTWKMGKKITIDSATLMNKGLEAIEAHHLFGVPMENIEIVIHPQSIVHSLVEFVDGSVIAQLSNPDMRLPIQYALTWPERRPSPLKPLDLASIGSLEFGKPDFGRFPCLALALAAGKKGGTLPVAMNAANEVAVNAFLNHKIIFTDIPAVVAAVIKKHRSRQRPGIAEIVDVDSASRRAAGSFIEALGRRVRKG